MLPRYVATALNGFRRAPFTNALADYLNGLVKAEQDRYEELPADEFTRGKLAGMKLMRDTLLTDEIK